MRKANSLLKFLEFVDKIPMDKNGCKIWPMGINSQGYGNYSIHNQTYSVHRLIYTTINKCSYYGLVVRHKCDNRACCNIDHLEIGTQSENIMDASRRNRLMIGENNNKTIFNSGQVLEIRRKYPEKSTVQLAEEYSVTPFCIQCIVSGKTWKHLPGSKPLKRNNSALGEKSGRCKLTEIEVLEIRKSYPLKKGPQLAKEYGVSHHNIYCILKRKNWTHI